MTPEQLDAFVEWLRSEALASEKAEDRAVLRGASYATAAEEAKRVSVIGEVICHLVEMGVIAEAIGEC